MSFPFGARQNLAELFAGVGAAHAGLGTGKGANEDHFRWASDPCKDLSSAGMRAGLPAASHCDAAGTLRQTGMAAC